MTYDALLLLSFGGPEGPEDVLPFLQNVTRGRNVSDERLAVVAEQYELFGGRSPINDQCRALKQAIEDDFAEVGLDLPVYWGNRNWHPYVTDTVSSMTAEGITNALVFVTSAFGSYSGCRQYREDLASAAEQAGSQAPGLHKLRLFYNHPGFIEPMAANLARSIAEGPDGARVVFTAHSIPESMASGCDYVEQLHDAASLVLATATGDTNRSYDLVFQSRSGPPHIPWLEPDVNDHLEQLAKAGETHVQLVPLGFVSDHMEVLYDLDTQARDTARRLDLGLSRVSTVGVDKRFVAMIRELVLERQEEQPRLFLGDQGPWPDDCRPGHCPAPARRRPSAD